jgi:protein tyrosine/serine phosphatase
MRKERSSQMAVQFKTLVYARDFLSSRLKKKDMRTAALSDEGCLLFERTRELEETVKSCDGKIADMESKAHSDEKNAKTMTTRMQKLERSMNDMERS